MKSFRRRAATVNAGSMADIAFLLLIFFLVTTTISADKGILRKLPPPCLPGQDCTADINERNVLRIAINHKQEIMIEDIIVTLADIEKLVKDFVDNNGTKTCDYCKGNELTESSEHPKKAVISLSHDASTKYSVFVSVQDAITKVYYELRERYANEVLNKEAHELTESELKTVKEAYPFIISEVMVKPSNEM